MLTLISFLGQIIGFLQVYQIYRRYVRNRHNLLRRNVDLVPHKIIRLLHGYRSTVVNTDVWANLEKNWNDFYWVSGETPPNLAIMVRKFHALFPRITGRRSKLSFRNQVLLVMIWLRRYPTMHHLANNFGISVASVCKLIHQMIPKLHAFIVPRYLNWHNLNHWNSLAGYIPEWPRVVAVLDCTPFRISSPKGPAQRLFYRRDRGFMFLNWLCIIDVKGFVVYSRPGFLGHLHDSTCYGHVQIPALPPGLRIMADQGFANIYPLLLPVLRQGRNLPHNIRRSFRRHRSLIERVFGVIKMSYACCGTRRYRGRRYLASLICNLSAGLANRRKIIFHLMRKDLRLQ